MSNPIISGMGYQGLYTLVYTNGFMARKNDIVHTFRGQEGLLTGGVPPHKSGSTGEVHVIIHGAENKFYPGVINAKWVLNSELP